MKFYSEITKKIYDDKEALNKAEKEEAEKQKKAELVQQERSVRAKEIESAYKTAVDDYNHYNELVNKFIDDYGSFHMTYNEHGMPFKSLFDILFNW